MQRFAEIAQLVEHFTRNEGVVGSSPIFSLPGEMAVIRLQDCSHFPLYRTIYGYRASRLLGNILQVIAAGVHKNPRTYAYCTQTEAYKNAEVYRNAEINMKMQERRDL